MVVIVDLSLLGATTRTLSLRNASLDYSKAYPTLLELGGDEAMWGHKEL
jgi:hypothetical protein